MEMFELLETVASASLTALAIAAGTVALIGGAIIGVAAAARSIGERRARRA